MAKLVVSQEIVDAVVDGIKRNATGQPKKNRELRSLIRVLNHRGFWVPVSDRHFRAAVAQARKAGVPICASDDGFWYADAIADITGQINRAASYRDELDAVVNALARTRLAWEMKGATAQ